MLTVDGTRARVIAWREKNGGHNGRLAGHALRMLCEAVEVCVAAGANRFEIETRVASELSKAETKGEFNLEVTVDGVREELADVSFLVDVLAHCTGNVDLEVERLAKLDILDQRAWEADADGVLWRPGHAPRAIMDDEKRIKGTEMRFTNDWLRKRIATEPDDAFCGAGRPGDDELVDAMFYCARCGEPVNRNPDGSDKTQDGGLCGHCTAQTAVVDEERAER